MDKEGLGADFGLEKEGFEFKNSKFLKMKILKTGPSSGSEASVDSLVKPKQ